ncbi:MAG TPA: flagellar hook-length control protein FliK, partial [Nitrosomonas sp.]|nr:flagellar hook-length control protein FliK [Nitrosomonas sp.]
TQVSAQFTSPHLAVREAIESALPRLREMMAENGITLGNTTVGAETSQQHANQQHGSIASNANENSTTTVATIQGLSTEFNGSVLPRHQGIINTFA